VPKWTDVGPLHLRKKGLNRRREMIIETPHSMNLGTPPGTELVREFHCMILVQTLVSQKGFEPLTHALRIRSRWHDSYQSICCKGHTRFIPLEGGQYLLVVVQKWLQQKRRVRLPDREPTQDFRHLKVADPNSVFNPSFSARLTARPLAHDAQKHRRIARVLLRSFRARGRALANLKPPVRPLQVF